MVASKFDSRKFSVAKNAELGVMKVTSHVSSCIDKLTKMILVLDNDENAERHARRCTLINTRGGFTVPTNRGEVLVSRAQWLMSGL